ncbi:MAG: hypothetical protein IKG42_01555 [Clostridia bacterium]|nr:hypothetical protein [Clostridia bacterium]
MKFNKMERLGIGIAFVVVALCITGIVYNAKPVQLVKVGNAVYEYKGDKLQKTYYLDANNEVSDIYPK